MYKPFPIYDLRYGKVTSRDPWLTPPDAFEILRNAHIRLGVLEKRRGYSEFGQMIATNTSTDADTPSTNPIMGIFQHTSNVDVDTLVVLDQDRLNKYDSSEATSFADVTRNQLRFKSGSGQTWMPTATTVIYGNTSHATGTVEAVVIDTGTFAGADANGTIIFTKGTVAGTFSDGEELQQQGTPANVAGVANGANADVVFTGDNTDFFDGVNWNGVLYLTNGNDPIHKFDGTHLTRLHIDLDVEGGPDNDISTAKFIVLHKQRLIIFCITERGTFYGYRARWCDVNDPDTWADLSYIDCPYQGQINGVGFLGDDLYVFFRNKTFRFAYTGDEDLPFAWQLVDSFEGSVAPRSATEFPDEIIFLAKNNMVGLDGNRTYHIDLANPTFVPTWKQDSLLYSQGRIWKDLRQGWMTYTSSAATAHADGNYYPDSVLVWDFIDKHWATYELPIHVMGISNLESSLTWNDVSDAWQDIDWSWADAGLQSGADVRLFGGRDGKIYRVDYTISDDGSAIEMDVRSSRWNPFWKDGYKARLGHIDFLVDADNNASFTVYCYKDTIATSWQSVDVDCSGNDEKIWVRVPCNGEEGEFHRIKIGNNAASNRPRIHAIVPYFAQGGRVF